MKNRLIYGLLVVAGLPFLSSCGGSDSKPSAGISFDISEEETTESDGTINSFNPSLITGGEGTDIKVKLVLDKPLSENAVITYKVGGTASRTSTANDVNDFNIEGRQALETETLVIEKGSSVAYITITVFEDYALEVDDTDDDGNYIETVSLTLSSVVSGPVKLGSSDKLKYTLNIKEDDDVFFLYWDKALDADLDFYVISDGDVITASNDENSADHISSDGLSRTEALYIPAGFPNGTYNMSYPFYSGESEPVDFDVYMLTTSGKLNGQSYPYSGTSALHFSGTYTQANVNKYDPENVATSVATVQTMVKSGLDYTNITNITVPSTGSRKSSISMIPRSLNKIQIKKLNQRFRGK